MRWQRDRHARAEERFQGGVEIVARLRRFRARANGELRGQMIPRPAGPRH